MSPPRFTPEFKDEAVRQITKRGYSVAEVSERLGVSAHSLYKWLSAMAWQRASSRRLKETMQSWPTDLAPKR